MSMKDKLIELLKSGQGDNSYYITTYAAEKVADHLLANGVTMQRWIPVGERLPNVNTNKSGYEKKGVIVLIEGDTKSAYRIYERACNRGKTVYRWKYPWDRISDEHITHWQELPEPPKGE